MLRLTPAPGVDAVAGPALASRSPPAYQWNLPPGFPVPFVPRDNPMSIAKVQLGRRLFREQQLSVTGHYACISCHKPALAYTDGRSRALGATGSATRRSSMTLANVAYNAAFTWGDSSVRTLEAQMQQPLFNEHPVEIGLKSREKTVLKWLSSQPRYQEQFAQAFGKTVTAISIGNLIKAIAAYERTLISGNSAFDRYVFRDDASAMSDGAKRGMALFYSKRVGCAQCHSGLNFDGPVRSERNPQAAPTFANTGLYSMDGRGSYPSSDPGLFDVTRKPADMGKMRVPTLRNICLTGPYMHDGSVASLSDAIDHYAQGGRQLPGGPDADNHLIDRRIQPFVLSPQQKSDLIAFLASLTDSEFATDLEMQPAIK
jgi:cytochrome c peroxidase